MRARVLAQSLTELGVSPAIVSTFEDASDLRTAPRLARSFAVPRRVPRLAFSLELARLVRRAAATSDSVIIGNAMFMPTLVLSRCRLPVIWDTNECQTLHYARLPRTPLNLLKRVAWRGLEAWAARRCELAVAIGEREATAWRRLHPQLADKLITVDHSVLATGPDGPDPKRHPREASAP